MRLKMTTNIGTKDATRLGLDPEKAKEGSVINVNQKTADELVKRGWGADPDAERAAVVTTEAAADFDAMTKEELKAFADANSIDGVTMTQHRDEMVKLVKKGAKKTT